MRFFASSFDIFISNNLPVFLLMTGLPENIDFLLNSDNLTFLCRAPKIVMNPLNMRNIANSYRNTLHISEEDAREMALLTKGYPYAFQLLGHYAYNENGDYKQAIPKCEEHLFSASYDKIWADLSAKDKYILYAIINTDSRKVQDIRKTLGMAPNEFSPYRERLIRRGVIYAPERGTIAFSLPFFVDYVKDREFYEKHL